MTVPPIHRHSSHDTSRRDHPGRDIPGQGDVALITDAPVSYTEQHDTRVRKYLLLMSMRIPALIVAAILFSVTGSWWLPLLVVVASLPLPWVAVLIANDGPPRAREDVDRYVWGAEPTQTAIAAPRRNDARVIES